MWLENLAGPPERVPTSPRVSDTTMTTTCYMCACRCGIRVHLRNGTVRYIEGNRNHPVNRGVLCAKGSAGIMHHYSPARLTKPLLRTGPRGSGEFREIEWDEALETATSWLAGIRESDPRKLAFFTGRDQSQGLTGFWASQFGTPNYAAHGGFCSVNMAAGGLYSIGGSFWEFGEPDWEHAKYFLMFGVAEDHDSNPIKIGLSKLRARGAKFLSVNPVRTGYSAIADEWIGIRPGTDGLLVLAICHELLRRDLIDLEFLVRYTNAAWLVRSDDGMFARDADGNPLAWDTERGEPTDAGGTGFVPAIAERVTLPDGTEAAPVFLLLAERYLDGGHAPEAVAERCGVPAETIRRLAGEIAHAAFEQEIVLDRPWTDWAGRTHPTTVGRPVSIHAMRGISAHSNGFHTCRALHLLQMLIGAVDRPGAFRYKAPFPRPAPPGPKPAGKPDQVAPGRPMPGPPLGFVTGPDDLLLEEDGATARRIDKAYGWEAPMAAHGALHTVIGNAAKGDPYPIDTLFLYMANVGWNSSMNVPGTLDMLTETDPETGGYRIPRIIYSDAFFSETIPYCDLILPDTTYLERWDCISLLDRPISTADGPADSIRQPVVAPDRDVRPFQDVLIELGTRLGLPAFTAEDGGPRYPGGYRDYIVNHERTPGVGPLAGWRGHAGEAHGKGEPNPDQLERYIENGCFWSHELEPGQKHFRFANRDYLEWAVSMGFIPEARPIVLQLYSEVLQSFRTADAPAAHRRRLRTFFDPLPIWYPPLSERPGDAVRYPYHALTQRPMAMYHSWGSQNAWLRQIHGRNPLFVARAIAERHGLEDGDWVRLSSHHGAITVPVKVMDGVNPHTVWTWNAIGKRRGAWNLSEDAPEAGEGFLLNHIIPDLLPEGDGPRHSNSDPVTGQAAWYDLRVALEKVPDPADRADGPDLPALKPPPTMPPRAGILRFGAEFRRRRP